VPRMTDRFSHSHPRPTPPVMGSAPLFPVALGVVVGVVIDHHAASALFVYPAILLSATVATLVLRSRLFIAIGIVMASGAVGGLLHASSQRVLPRNSIERLTDNGAQIVRVRGEVCTEPRLHKNDDRAFARWGFRGDRTSFVMEAVSVEGTNGPVPVSGRVQVFVREAVLDLADGERIELTGWLYPLRPPRNPGAFDWASYQRRQGIVASMTVNHRRAIQRLGFSDKEGMGGVLRAFRASARHWLISDLAASAEEERGLLEAMVIGQRSRLDRRLNDVFINAGCVHFLAVSGIHLVIVMLIARVGCVLVSTLMILSGGAGLRRVTQTWVLLIAVVLYVLLAEPRPSILRAGIIAVVCCVARLLGREGARLNWISFAVIILALIDPGMVFDVGYQLSTVAVLGVSFLAPALRTSIEALRHPFSETSLNTAEPLTLGLPVRGLDLGWRRFAGTMWRTIFVALAAWLATVPIVAFYFGQIHPWAPMNSLLILPLVMVVMALGFAKLLVAPLLPAIGMWLSSPLDTANKSLIWCVNRLGHLPSANVEVTAPPVWVILSFYAVLIAFVLYGQRVHPFRLARVVHDPRATTTAPRRASGWVLVAATMLVLITGAAWRRPHRAADRMVVTVLSVGAGSAAVIELPEGQTILFDAGSLTQPNVGRRVIVPFLKSRGIQRVDRIYVSHANLDHFNGVPGVVEQIDTGLVIVNTYFKRQSGARSAGRRLLAVLRKAGYEVEILDLTVTTWHYGGATFELMWPPVKDMTNLQANDTSTVLRISYEGHSILLTGDIEDYPQVSLIDRGDLHADVLVLPHHGGVTSSTAAFLDAVDADVLIRSSHQPMTKTYNGLANIITGRTLFNTADNGAIRVTIDRTGVHVAPFVAPGEPHTLR